MRAIAVLTLLALGSAAHAAPHGIYRLDRVTPQAVQTDKATKLLYYGGPVISHAKIYVVFWGGQVNAEVRAKIPGFLASMIDSPYMDWLHEYDTVGLTAVDGRAGTNQRINRGSFAGTFTIQPKRQQRALDDKDVQAELEEQIAAGRLPANTPDTLYMTYFAPGVSITIEGGRSCMSFGAYHEGFNAKNGTPVFYGVMPDCGYGYDEETSVTSHEALEAITDPFPTPGSNPAYPQAWNTSGGDEVADLCVGANGKLTSRGLTSVVQAEWSNAAGSCISGPWSDVAADVAASGPRPAIEPAPLFKALSGAAAPRWDGAAR